MEEMKEKNCFQIFKDYNQKYKLLHDTSFIYHIYNVIYYFPYTFFLIVRLCIKKKKMTTKKEI